MNTELVIEMKKIQPTELTSQLWAGRNVGSK